MIEETLFELAVNTAAAEREELLDRECAGDPALRARVEALLQAFEGPDPLPWPSMAAPTLDLPASDRPTATAPPGPDDATRTAPGGPGAAVPGRDDGSFQLDESPVEGAGQVLADRYRLARAIGEGGMGCVYLAQQFEPVRRLVAVKVIKAGMDSRAVLARFEAERQALAMMDHPNIARVLDAGTTREGRPFFVMELVKGVPITRYCDENRLTTRQRLELFEPVCRAIQHAHQKGIIHRDIKPSNVLVALYDDRPVPKVIDFGVAKATGPQLTDQPAVTGFGAIVGTPEYMSPEQAGFNNQDVDTRSDVYALGVLLYELLTGTTPVDRASLRRAALMEVLRVVREVDAPRPSDKLSTVASLPSVAANRGIEPARLAGLLRGELDWVVMKALEKDRDRRYDSANALAGDVRRYLADEVVEARPPGTWYRVRKLARRHRGRVIAASLVLLSLVAGVIGTSWGLVRAERARKAAAERAEGERLAKLAAQAAEARSLRRLGQIERGNEALNGIFEDLDVRKVKAGVEPLEAVLAGRLARAAGQIEGESVGNPLAVASLQDRLGRSLENLGFATLAVPILEKARATRMAGLGPDHPETLRSASHLAMAYKASGHLGKALPLYEETLRLGAARLGPDHPDNLIRMNDLALAYRTAGRWGEAIALFEPALKFQRAKFGPDDPNTLLMIGNLAGTFRDAGQPARAVPLHQEALRLQRARLGPDHPDTLLSLNNLASALWAAGRAEEALPMAEEALRLQRARLGPDHPDTLLSLNNLATSTWSSGRKDQALPLFEEAARLRQAKLGPDHPDTLLSLNNLAVAYQGSGQAARAVPLLEEVLTLRKAKLGPDHPDTLVSLNNLAQGYRAVGQPARQVPLLEEALGRMEVRPGRAHPSTLLTMANLGVAYRDAGRSAEAIPLLEEAHRVGQSAPTLRWVGPALLEAYARGGRSAEAVAISKDVLAEARKTSPAGGPALASTLAEVGSALARAKAFDEAEPILRECLTIREKAQPDSWSTFNTRSVLGGALLGRGDLAGAEGPLLEGYRGMKAREATIPPAAAARLPEALDRLIEYYTAAGKPEEVERWKAERASPGRDAGPGPREPE